MPLNIKKNYAFIPAPVGAVRLFTRASTRARLTNETYYRSKEWGVQANQVMLTIVEDLTHPLIPEGLLVTQHTVLNPVEMTAATGMSLPAVSIYSMNMNWDEEIRVTSENGVLVAKLYGIRWQIGGGETLLATLGQVIKNRIFNCQQASFKLSAGPSDFPTGAIFYLRPRTRRYHLVSTSVTDPITMISTTGWDIGALRVAVNTDVDAWITMPERGTGDDIQDTGTDAMNAIAFTMTPLKGGDGLPVSPAGLNTGPDRALMHLNYSEQQNGSFGVLNQVFEWVGETSSLGSWQRYS